MVIKIDNNMNKKLEEQLIEQINLGFELLKTGVLKTINVLYEPLKSSFMFKTEYAKDSIKLIASFLLKVAFNSVSTSFSFNVLSSGFSITMISPNKLPFKGKTSVRR